MPILQRQASDLRVVMPLPGPITFLLLSIIKCPAQRRALSPKTMKQKDQGKLYRSSDPRPPESLPEARRRVCHPSTPPLGTSDHLPYPFHEPPSSNTKQNKNIAIEPILHPSYFTLTHKTHDAPTSLWTRRANWIKPTTNQLFSHYSEACLKSCGSHR